MPSETAPAWPVMPPPETVADVSYMPTVLVAANGARTW